MNLIEHMLSQAYVRGRGSNSSCNKMITHIGGGGMHHHNTLLDILLNKRIHFI